MPDPIYRAPAPMLDEQLAERGVWLCVGCDAELPDGTDVLCARCSYEQGPEVSC